MSTHSRYQLSIGTRKRIYWTGNLLIAASFVLILLAAFVPGVERQMVPHPISVGSLEMTATFFHYTLIFGLLFSLFPLLWKVGTSFAEKREWIR